MNESKHNQSQSLKSPLAEGVGGWRLSIFDLDWWQEVVVGITSNKVRSVMTGFGVFWGMFMLILLMGAGVGLSKIINEQIDGFATNSCFFDAEPTSEPYKGFRKGRYWHIVNSDIPILVSRIPEIEHIAPVLFGGRGTDNVVYGDKTGSYGVKGNYPSYNKIEVSNLIYGRYINDIDIVEKRKVCVIGERVYEELFNKGTNPVGKNIRVNGIYFRVIGVAQGNSNISIGGRSEEMVVLPFSTMQQAYNHGNRVHFVAATAKSGIKVSYLEQRIKEELKVIHSISPTDNTAVWTMNLEQMFTMFTILILAVKIIIFIVGVGTMLTGGISVSNIMLVTVRERTKEIGIRRALGATPGSIRLQIMSESIILTIISGILGLLLGVGVLALLGQISNDPNSILAKSQVDFSFALGAFALLVVIGAFAAYMPVKRALNIKAIEAIREE